MNDWKPRSDDRKEDVSLPHCISPPYSRIFVVCSKDFKEEDLKRPFEKFGDIENFHMPRDHQTGESKGVAYIKYTLTSAAAAAIQGMNQKCIGDANKPIKVMIATQKNDKPTDEKKCVRLFIKTIHSDTEQTLEDHFSTFGELRSVFIHKNNARFAYVTYNTFYNAAKAFEQCDRRYRAVFAVPKEELKRGRDSFEQNMGSPSMSSCSLNNRDKFQGLSYRDNHPNGNPLLNHQDASKRICVTVSPPLHEKYIRSLFNIIPGMEDFVCSQDSYNNVSKATITYGDQNAAASAVERLNKFEFPSGEMAFVKLDSNPIAKAATEISNMVNNLKSALDVGDNASGLVQLADAIAQASSLIKVASTGINEPEPESSRFCSVRLPPVQPLATTNIVAKRCFIVCKPQPPPFPILKDAFCRFGDMIHIHTFPNKTFGFVKYASEKSAQEAIRTLNEAVICGVTIKVMEADDRHSDDSDVDRKRLKMDTDSK